MTALHVNKQVKNSDYFVIKVQISESSPIGVMVKMVYNECTYEIEYDSVVGMSSPIREIVPLKKPEVKPKVLQTQVVDAL